jgi:hypothetical protein
VRTMFDNEAVEPDVIAVARFVYATGITGILANLPLIATMYTQFCLRAGNPVPGYLGIPVWFVFLRRSLGSAMG